jgi:hypothetical protein
MTGLATGMPAGSWPCGWLGAATWTGPNRSPLRGGGPVRDPDVLLLAR